MIFNCDFETTDLVHEGVSDFLAQPGIVQIGVTILNDKYDEVASWESLVNPEKALSQWSEGAIKVHGITPSMVDDAPTFFAVFDKIAELALGCDAWSGYNTPFDKSVLWFQLLRYGFERSFPWPRRDLDVMKFAKDFMAMEGKRGVKPPKLIEIYEHLFPGESFDAHDALEDVRASARVLKELKK